MTKGAEGHSPVDAIDTLVSLALAEDLGEGCDWTTQWTVDEATRAEALITAKEPMVVAGVEAARRSFEAVDSGLEISAHVSDGGRVGAGEMVMAVSGSARSILTAERTALNFLGRLSGIASLTGAFVDEVEGTGVHVLDTRKTTPGWRALEKWATRVGGATNHRMGLHDMILVKDNHQAAAGGLRAAVLAVTEANHQRLPVEVEVSSPDALEELEGLSVDLILLDNMTEAALEASVARVSTWPAPRPELEASGNITLDRVRRVAETGVDRISVGAITHSARSMDFSLTLSLEEAEG